MAKSSLDYAELVYIDNAVHKLLAQPLLWVANEARLLYVSGSVLSSDCWISARKMTGAK